MSHSLVPKKPIKLPKEYERFFIPPLVGNEKREDYDVVFDAVAMAQQPQDMIQWLNVKEYADNSWELQRERTGFESRFVNALGFLSNAFWRSKSALVMAMPDGLRHFSWFNIMISALTRRSARAEPSALDRSWPPIVPL